MRKKSHRTRISREISESYTKGHRNGRRFLEFQRTIGLLPSIETRTIEWFRYLGASGADFMLPFTEYFNTWRGNWYVQLFFAQTKRGAEMSLLASYNFLLSAS